MNEPDFSGVMPTRLEEALRRIKVIEAYLAIELPTGNDTVAAAEKLGISRWAFTRLAKSWRNHRDPALLVRSQNGPSRRDYGIAEQAKEIALRIIHDKGMEAEISNVAPVVEEACRNAGLTPPSRPTIYNYILAERSGGALKFNQDACVLIGRMWFQLPMQDKGLNEMPCALLAVSLPERVVLAHAISAQRDKPPSVQEVSRTLIDRASNGGALRDIVMDRLDAKIAGPVFSELGYLAPKPSRLSPQRLLARAFGDRMGELKPVYHSSGALAKPPYTMGRHDKPLTVGAAVAVIEAAIESSNAMRDPVMPFNLRGNR